MKLFKKLSALVVAMLLALSMCLFAACGDKNPDDKNDGNNGDTNQDGNTNNNDNHGDGVDDFSVVAGDILNALKSQTVSAAELFASQTLEVVNELNVVDENGTFIAFNSSLEGGRSSNTTGVIDFENGDADLFNVTQEAYAYKYANQDDETYEGTEYTYEFLRSWNALMAYFDEDDYEENIDWSEKSLYYSNTLDPDNLYGGQCIEELTALFLAANAHLIALAEETGAFSYDSATKTATVDINKMIDVILGEISAEVDKFTITTTVGDVLGNEVIKKYVGDTLNLLPAELLVEIITNMDKYGMLTPILEAVQPDEDSCGYDYLIKIVESEELAAMVNAIIEGEYGIEDAITETVAKTPFSIILQLNTGSTEDADLATALASYQKTVKDLSDKTTATEFVTGGVVKVLTDDTSFDYKATDELVSTTTYSGMKVEYVVNDNYEVQSFKFTSTSDGYENRIRGWGSNGTTTTYNLSTDDTHQSSSCEIKLISSVTSLIDIDDVTVNRSQYEIADGEYSRTIRLGDSDSYVNLKITIENGIGTTFTFSQSGVLVEKDGDLEYDSVELNVDGEVQTIYYVVLAQYNSDGTLAYFGIILYMDEVIPGNKMQDCGSYVISRNVKSYTITVGDLVDGKNWELVTD